MHQHAHPTWVTWITPCPVGWSDTTVEAVGRACVLCRHHCFCLDVGEDRVGRALRCYTLHLWMV